jgi:hypothetical protein
VAPPGSAWRSGDRRKLDTLARYLQRACAKNDTQSLLGPFAVGRLDDDLRGITWRPAPTRQFPSLSRWAAEALVKRIFADPDVWPRLMPRRKSSTFLTDHRLEVVDLDTSRRSASLARVMQTRPPVDLDTDTLALLDLCTGDRTLAEIVRLAGRDLGRPDLDVPSALERLRMLEGLGAVTVGPELPVGL